MRFQCVLKLTLWLLVAATVGFISTERVNAQVLYGSVAGTVTDQTGAVVPGAAITIVNDNTGFTRNTTSASAGDYHITDLPAGTYSLTVNAQGFKPVKHTGITVSVGSTNQQDLQLSVGAVTQEVTVAGSAVSLQTQTTDVHTTISSYAVENLPLNVYHNFQSVELLAPGVVSLSAIQNNYPNSLADAPDRSLAINSNGLPQHINTSRVDGATNVFLWLPDHMVVVPPAATVQEVNVQTSNFNVQKGLTAGAATDVITKSGTNQFHGNLYGYHTDQALNAQNALVHTSGAKPKDIRNNDGVSVGGPIMKNKMFFFANWDGYYQRQNAADTGLIPPEDMRNGDYSAYLGDNVYSCAAVDANGNCSAPVPVMVQTTEGAMVQLRQGMVFDPTTGDRRTGEGRQVFSSGGALNVIPASRIYAGATNFWQLMAPYTPNNTLGQPFTEDTAENDIRLRNSSWDRNIYTGKVDYNISDRQSIWAKYTLQKAILNDGSDYGVAGQGEGTGLTHDTAQTVTLGHTWTAKPDLVLTGHVGFTRMGEHNQLPDFGKEFGQTVLGLTNSNTPLDDPRYSGMPGVTLGGGFTALGTNQSWEPMWRNDWQLTLDENATWIKGKHSIVFGFDAAHNHMNHWQPEILCCVRGNIFTSSDNTFLNLATDAAGVNDQPQMFDSGGNPVGFNSAPWNAIAEFNLGLANEVQNGQQFIKLTNKDWQEALYIGDTFRLTQKLTVTAGVRWEYFPLITRDGASKFEVYDPTKNQLVLGGLGGNDTHLGNTPLAVSSSKKLFAPRLGLAYQLDSKTVVRSAFGITYDTLPLERPLRGFFPYTIAADNFVAGDSNVTRFLPVSSFSLTSNANSFPGLQDGVPLIQGPSGFESGVLTPPGNVVIGSLGPGEYHRGYVESWNFTVERKLPGSILLNAGYVGNHLVHEFNFRDINAAPLGTGGDGQPLSIPFGRNIKTLQGQGYLDSHYNSLQVSVYRRVSTGLFLQGSYTYSHAIAYEDDEAASSSNSGLRFNCPPSDALPQGCQPFNRGAPSFDHTHILKMAFVYHLPFGTGQRWITSGPAKYILGGWQTNGILTGISGAPLTVTQSSSFLNTPATSQVPDNAGGLNMLKETGPGRLWFNTDAFVPTKQVRLGTAGRGLSWLRGPGLTQLDFSVFRNFKLAERYNLALRFEMLNLSNTPHWDNPSTSCSIKAGPGDGVCGGGFGQITDAFGERIFQIGAQIDF
ncbi:MAG TPA: TonB-dependent receptor [Terriglobia bacterium]|nr:TonB-dependent receptor [Terriglobia bacterium]